MLSKEEKLYFVQFHGKKLKQPRKEEQAMETKIKINLGEIAPQIQEQLNEVLRLSEELNNASRKLFFNLSSGYEVTAKLDDEEK